ncbi:MAG: MATE family efflux transporter [bacterium]
MTSQTPLERPGLGRSIWRIAWPVMLMHLLYTALSITDLFWVGRLGPASVAAVALGGSVMAVLFSIGQVFGVATLALAARASGAGSRAGAVAALRHAVVPAVAVAAVIAAAGIPLAGTILRLLRAAPEVVTAGAGYLVVLFAYLPAFFAGMTAYSLFQATGDTRTPMFVILATNLFNAALDPVLIFGWFGLPQLGVLGAALATAASHLLYLVIVGAILRRRGLLVLGGRFEWQRVRTVFRVGVPAGLAEVTRPVTGMLLFSIVNGFGVAAAAAFGIGLRLLGVIFIYLAALQSAGEALVGQSLGRKDPDFARAVSRRVALVAVLLQLAVMPLVFAFAPLVVRVFSADPEVIRVGTGYLRVLAPFLVLAGLNIGWASAQRGAGDTRPPMLAAVAANWVVKLPLAWVLAHLTGLGVSGVWFGIGVSVAAESALLGASYRSGRWLVRELEWQ